MFKDRFKILSAQEVISEVLERSWWSIFLFCIPRKLTEDVCAKSLFALVVLGLEWVKTMVVILKDLLVNANA